MVKHYKENLQREELCQNEKLEQKAALLAKLRRQDHIKDNKRHCLKHGLTYKKSPITLHDVLESTSTQLSTLKIKDETQKQVNIYKIALENSERVLGALNQTNIKNQRPDDYLVEMYKSDKQMFKVRRYLTDKEDKVKEKMQGKDWLSKTKKKERAKKKAEAKKARKKSKLAAKRPVSAKPSMNKAKAKFIKK